MKTNKLNKKMSFCNKEYSMSSKKENKNKNRQQNYAFKTSLSNRIFLIKKREDKLSKKSIRKSIHAYQQ